MTERYGQTATKQRPTESSHEDEDDLSSMTGTATAPAATLDESGLFIDEVEGTIGDSSGNEGEAGGDVNMHDEVSTEGGRESAEEYAEASAEQMAMAPSSGESAFADLRNIDGYEMNGLGEHAALEAALEAAEEFRLDAGAGVSGQQEFLPVVASLASTILPTLASSVGPAIAKGITKKLSSRAKAVLKRRRQGGGLLSTVARLLEAAEMQPASESSIAEADDATVDEMVQVLEVIIGTDDRVRVTRTRDVPWRRLCALRIQMRNGAIFRGTGFLIGPHVLATAGHCIYMHDQGGWARSVEVIPGSNGTARPFGQATATTFRSVRGWVTDRKPEADYGCIVLPSGAFSGQQLGSFGVKSLPAPMLLAKQAVLAGYPGDKPFAELWGMGRRIKTVTATQLIYEIDTVGGQSGAPVYIKQNGNRYVVGIHNYGAATGNSATRVTSSVLQNLHRWSKLGT